MSLWASNLPGLTVSSQRYGNLLPANWYEHGRHCRRNAYVLLAVTHLSRSITRFNRRASRCPDQQAQIQMPCATHVDTVSIHWNSYERVDGLLYANSASWVFHAGSVGECYETSSVMVSISHWEDFDQSKAWLVSGLLWSYSWSISAINYGCHWYGWWQPWSLGGHHWGTSYLLATIEVTALQQDSR